MTLFRLEQGPVPLHHQVYLDLRAGLDAGEWAPGDRLPPERELADRYGCSLITVRRALSELAREQRLQRTPGRGTTVLRPPIERDFAGTMSFTDEMQTRGLDPGDPGDRRPGPGCRRGGGRSARARGGLADPVLRTAPPSPTESRLLLEQVYLPAERFPGLLASDLEHTSLYDLLTERYETPIVRARESLEPVLLRSREARLLQQRPRTPALLIRGVAFAADHSPVEFGRTYVRGDRTRYYVERVVVRSRLRGSGRDPSLDARSVTSDWNGAGQEARTAEGINHQETTTRRPSIDLGGPHARLFAPNRLAPRRTATGPGVSGSGVRRQHHRPDGGGHRRTGIDRGGHRRHRGVRYDCGGHRHHRGVRYDCGGRIRRAGGDPVVLLPGHRGGSRRYCPPRRRSSKTSTPRTPTSTSPSRW